MKMLQNSMGHHAILLPGFETSAHRLAQFFAEQRGDPACVTVKVHSLGVICYERNE